MVVVRQEDEGVDGHAITSLGPADDPQNRLRDLRERRHEEATLDGPRADLDHAPTRRDKS